MSFDNYIIEMMGEIENIDLQIENFDQSNFDQILELLMYRLSKSVVDWSDSGNNRLQLSYDGTFEGIVDLVLELVKTVVSIINESTIELAGNLDRHIMNMLFWQFSIRLLYHRAGRKVDATLGKLKIEYLIPTIQQKPVKLYNVLKESHVTFMSANFPDAIMIEEKLEDKADE